MALFRRIGQRQQDAMLNQQLAEENLRRQLELEQARFQGTNSAVGQLLGGISQLSQDADTKRQRELDQQLKYAELADIGNLKNPNISKAPGIQQAKVPDQAQWFEDEPPTEQQLLDLQAASGELAPRDPRNTPTKLKLNQYNDLENVLDPNQVAATTTPSADAKAGQTAQAPAPTEKTPAPKDKLQEVEDEQAKAFKRRYQPLEWERTAEEAAQDHVDALLKSKEPNEISNLISFGAAKGQYEQAKSIAYKMALKAVREGRNKAEKDNFSKWSDETKLEQDSILKSAQAQKAIKQAQGVGTVGIKMTGKAVDDLRAGQNASLAVSTVSGLFNNLAKKGGDGLPGTLPMQKLRARALAAAADVDASGASVSGGAGGIGVSASVGGAQSRGGKYVDDKIIDDLIADIDKLEMTPAQREFMRESLLMTQTLGKVREGGRMTDSDLRFYIKNLLNAESPEALASALQRRANEVKMDYNSIYGTYVGDEPRWANHYKKPEDFKWDFNLDWKKLEYGSEKEYNDARKNWTGRDEGRVTQIQNTFQEAGQTANELGLGRKADATAPIEAGGKKAADAAMEIIDGKKKEKPQPKAGQQPPGGSKYH